MSTEKIRSQSFDSLKKDLLNLLQDKSYGDDTLNNYRRKLNQLERYMTASEIDSYEPSVDRQFINDYLATHTLSKSGRQFLHTVIRRLDEFRIGDYRIQRKADRVPLTQNHAAFLKVYLQECRADGNRESTISGKDTFLRDFLSHLTDLGCQDIRNADAAVIGRASR